MNTKVYVVTGATSGLGKAVALELAKTGATVILVGRDPDRGAQVEKEIASAAKNANTDLQLSDLSNLSSVRNLAEILNSKYEKIDVLINNAGIYKRQRSVTVDGFEEMFATNHLGPFLLTHLLLDRLLASTSARILNVTAPSTSELKFDDLQGEREFKSLSAFGASKMSNLLFTYELARRTADTHIRVNAYHPGLVRSPLMKEAVAPLRLLTRLFSSPPQRAALDLVQLATAPEFETTHGKFLHRGKEMEPSSYALDPLNQSKLWEVSERLTGISQS
ncbi:MAG TPA: SDR family NAD(P)-dependent oxidoreductase [Anaerolineales bacterium]|nr:SDR family NAD(P)-dependent oxidoreductase [Anaerolineales bacterium]